MSSDNRPSKKQRELLGYIDGFITGYGYGPSYREVMHALNYKSVSTVALHIDNLIKKGHLRKRDRSARSPEVVKGGEYKSDNNISPQQQKWLIELVGSRFMAVEAVKKPIQKQVDGLYVLVGALQVLGLEDAARSFKPRLLALHKK